MILVEKCSVIIAAFFFTFTLPRRPPPPSLWLRRFLHHHRGHRFTHHHKRNPSHRRHLHQFQRPIHLLRPTIHRLLVRRADELAAMEILTRELTEDILSRLPIKSLVRFRCVSMSWNSDIFNTTAFSKLRFQNSPLNPQMDAQKLLISTPNHSLKTLAYQPCFFSEDPLYLDFPLKKPNTPVIIWGSCKGLVCVSIENCRDIFVWNPSTGIYRKLPDPGRDGGGGGDFLYYSYGFGYDSVSDDFKAVIVSSEGEHQAPYSSIVKTKLDAKVFSLTANSWKVLLPKIDTNGSFCDPNGWFLNGAIHWKPRDLQAETIVGFDVASEEFFEVPMPDWMIRNSGLFQRLGVLQGSLCITHFAPPSFHVRQLWVMKEYGKKESWTPLVEKCLFGYSVLPLCDTERDCILLDGGDLLKYDLKDGWIEILTICRESDDCVVVPYIESPISPFSWNE